jgi:hypothetical protein
MTTAVIGVGNIGGAIARHLVRWGEPVVLAAKDRSRAEALPEDLGGSAGAAEVVEPCRFGSDCGTPIRLGGRGFGEASTHTGCGSPDGVSGGGHPAAATGARTEDR